MTDWFNIIPLLVIFVGGVLFLISSRKPVVFASVGSIMVAEFIIDFQFGSFSSALVRLVASLSALFAIYLSMKEINNSLPRIPRNSLFFRTTAYIMFVSVSVLLATGISDFLSIPIEITVGGLIAIFCGLLQLGISTSPSKVVIGIIILDIGFASIYCILESSLLVNGLISAVLLLLGGLGAYFVVREVTVEN
jgi:hypothetical protein